MAISVGASRLLKALALSTTNTLLTGILASDSIEFFQFFGLLGPKYIKFSKEEIDEFNFVYKKRVSFFNNKLKPYGIIIDNTLSNRKDSIKIKCSFATNKIGIKQKEHFSRLLTKSKQALIENTNDFVFILAKSKGTITTGTNDRTAAMVKLVRRKYGLLYAFGATENSTIENCLTQEFQLSDTLYNMYSINNNVISENLFSSIDKLYNNVKTNSILQNVDDILNKCIDVLTDFRLQRQDDSAVTDLLTILFQNPPKNIPATIDTHDFIQKFSNAFSTKIKSKQLRTATTPLLSRYDKFKETDFNKVISIQKNALNITLFYTKSRNGLGEFAIKFNHKTNALLEYNVIHFLNMPGDEQKFKVFCYVMKDNNTCRFRSNFSVFEKRDVYDFNTLIDAVILDFSSTRTSFSLFEQNFIEIKNWL